MAGLVVLDTLAFFIDVRHPTLLFTPSWECPLATRSLLSLSTKYCSPPRTIIIFSCFLFHFFEPPFYHLLLGQQLWGRRDWIRIPGGWGWGHSTVETCESTINWSACEVPRLWSAPWWWERNGCQQSLCWKFERCHAKDLGSVAPTLIVRSLQDAERLCKGAAVLFLNHYRSRSTECLINWCLTRKSTIQGSVMIRCKLLGNDWFLRNDN